jgi:hypothetical protein
MFPVGTCIKYQLEGEEPQICHIIGNYSLTDGEVRTAKDGMIWIGDIQEILPSDDLYTRCREEVQKIKSDFGLEDAHYIKWERLLRDMAYNSAPTFPMKGIARGGKFSAKFIKAFEEAKNAIGEKWRFILYFGEYVFLAKPKLLPTWKDALLEQREAKAFQKEFYGEEYAYDYIEVHSKYNYAKRRLTITVGAQNEPDDSVWQRAYDTFVSQRREDHRIKTLAEMLAMPEGEISPTENPNIFRVDGKLYEILFFEEGREKASHTMPLLVDSSEYIYIFTV